MSSDGDSYFNSGNVGIGTNSPDKKLEILSTASNHLRLAYSETAFWDLFQNAADGSFRILKDNGSLFTFAQSGNLGIGTDSPKTTLDITGSGNTAINSKGNLLVSSGGTATQVAETGGQISFGSWLNGDLTQPYPLAAIRGVAESSTSNNNRGALIFGTMDSNTTVQERMRLTSGGLVKINPGTASNTSYDALALTGGANSTSGSGAKLYLSGTVNDPITRGTIIEGLMTDNSNGHALVFSTSGASAAPTERMRLTSGGVVEITNGIKLGGTAAANLLDDYEEGTFTPVLTRSSGGAISATYTTQEGNYIKIGSIVYIQIYINISAIASQGSGYAILTGLPFSSLQFAYTQISNVSSNIFGSTNVQKSFTSSQSMYFGEASITNFPPLQTAYSVGLLRVCGTYRV